MTVQIDFYDDWIQILRTGIIGGGYDLASDETEENIERIYFNLLQRRIETRPRDVLISREFHCPDEHRNAVTKILEKAKIGDELVPYQSRTLNLKKNSEAKDAMLFHWGIHHLHLRPEGGLNELLFVRVTSNHLYVIKFGDHKKWFDMEALRIIHRNWPESIAKYRAPNSIHCDEFTDEQIDNLVGKNANFLISIDGVCYFPLGGGTVSAGFNIDTIRKMDYMREWIRRLENEARGLRSRVLTVARKQGWRPGNSLTLHLEFHKEAPYCVNKEYGIRCQLRSE